MTSRISYCTKAAIMRLRHIGTNIAAEYQMFMNLYAAATFLSMSNMQRLHTSIFPDLYIVLPCIHLLGVVPLL